MSFQIKSHIIPTQHIRQTHSSPTASAQQLLLAVKQYIPINNPSPSDGDITIIAAHANGFVKELYEPLWEDLLKGLGKRGRKVRAIWIADQWNQGGSRVLNEEHTLDDASWYDHSRDLLHMVNHFRTGMVQPIFGIGHSMGANQLAILSLAHPSLFTSLLLLEPIIHPQSIRATGPLMTRGVLRRKTSWSTREAASSYLKKAFRGFDPRVLEKFEKFGVVPHEGWDERGKEVRLVTGRYQELAGILRPVFIYSGSTVIKETDVEQMPWVNESLLLHDLLDFIPCNTIFICGKQSMSASKEIREDWLKRTAVKGHIWNGKRGERRVEEAVVEGAGHFAPFEKPELCAENIGEWVDGEIGRWESEREVLRENWGGLGREEKERRAEEWTKSLRSKL